MAKGYGLGPDLSIPEPSWGNTPSQSDDLRSAERRRSRSTRTRAVDNTNEPAYLIVRDFLAQYGLEGLTQWAWGKYKEYGGGDTALKLIDIELPETDQYKQRFPAAAALAKMGRAMTAGEMVAYEKAAAGILRSAGVPEGFYDKPEDYAKWMEGQVSIAELSQRAAVAQQYVYDRPDVVAELERFGVGHGDAIAFVLDGDKALPEITRRAQAASISALSGKAGFGPLARTEAEQLAAQGVSDQQASQGFGEIARDQSLAGNLIGETSGDAVSRDEQLSATFSNDAAARRRIEAKRQRRLNEFSGSGGFAVGREGVSGLASNE